jgi:photosystem II stability/assembly factor-like uncharacterized protein
MTAKELMFYAALLIALCIASCKDDRNEQPPVDMFWEKTSLDSVRVLALGSSPNGNLFAGTSDPRSALMRSSDDGRHWFPHSGPAPGFVYAIGFSPSGLGLAAMYDGTRSSFIRSVDSGLTWQSVSYSETVFVRTFIFDNMGQIFFGSTQGIYRSTDGGVTWGKVNAMQMSVNAMTVLPNGFIFVGTDQGGFRSTNSGISWERTEFGLPIDVVTAAASNANGVLLASTCGDAVYRSYDYGTFWQSTSLRIPCIRILAASSVGCFFAGRGGNPPMEDPEGIFTSTDGGLSWTGINGGLAELDVISFCTSSSGHVFVGTGSRGIFRSVRPIGSHID